MFFLYFFFCYILPHSWGSPTFMFLWFDIQTFIVPFSFCSSVLLFFLFFLWLLLRFSFPFFLSSSESATSLSRYLFYNASFLFFGVASCCFLFDLMGSLLVVLSIFTVISVSAFFCNFARFLGLFLDRFLIAGSVCKTEDLQNGHFFQNLFVTDREKIGFFDHF